MHARCKDSARGVLCNQCKLSYLHSHGKLHWAILKQQALSCRLLGDMSMLEGAVSGQAHLGAGVPCSLSNVHAQPAAAAPCGHTQGEGRPVQQLLQQHSTLVTLQGKGSNPKSTLYVGGLEESINEAILHSAFIAFGEIKDVNIPLDNTTGKHRGFGFVEYEDKADATDAIDNMHNAELYGRVLRVNYAQPMKIKGGDKGWSHQPVWADADDWFERQTAEEQLDKLDEEQRQKRQKELSEKHNPRDPMQPQDAMQALEATAG